MRVLVVDDVEAIRVLVRRALSAVGYQVDVAATLSEARQLDPGRYDAILVDASLGADQGLDLIEELRAADPDAAGRCLVMTGGTADAVPAGVACLTKPFQLEQLRDAVRALQQPSPSAPAPGQPSGTPPPPAARDREKQTDGPHPGTELPDASLPGGPLLCLVRQLRSRERRELAGFLHDGPIQELTAAMLRLEMTIRTAADPALCQVALKQVQAAAASLRWLVDRDWVFTEADSGLAAALGQRTAWLLAAPAALHPDSTVAEVAEVDVTIVTDVIELMLLAILPPGPPVLADVTVRAAGGRLQIELALTAPEGQPQPRPPATAWAALAGLASALGVARADFSGDPYRAQITLPMTSPCPSLPSFPAPPVTASSNYGYLR